MIQRATPLQLRFAEGELTVVARTQEAGESPQCAQSVRNHSGASPMTAVC
jgi:hypothetical protein